MPHSLGYAPKSNTTLGGQIMAMRLEGSFTAKDVDSNEYTVIMYRDMIDKTQF